jgi:hypothetical protein
MVDDIPLDQIADQGPRNVMIASINLRPNQTHSGAESVRQFLETAGGTVRGKKDVILLPEGITVAGTGKAYAEVAETIPGGPTTERIGELARKRSSYVAAGIYEREGTAIYHTTVLIDRAGNVYPYTELGRRRDPREGLRHREQGLSSGVRLRSADGYHGPLRRDALGGQEDKRYPDQWLGGMH